MLVVRWSLTAAARQRAACTEADRRRAIQGRGGTLGPVRDNVATRGSATTVHAGACAGAAAAASKDSKAGHTTRRSVWSTCDRSVAVCRWEPRVGGACNVRGGACQFVTNTQAVTTSTFPNGRTVSNRCSCELPHAYRATSPDRNPAAAVNRRCCRSPCHGSRLRERVEYRYRYC